MAEHIFERLAHERDITVEEMRAIISARIEKGWNDPDPEKRAQWRKYLVLVRYRHTRRMVTICSREHRG